ncbi:NAD(P)-binding protein [Aspergillus heterothallicus]
MTTFQKVALLGRGTLGSIILDELLNAQFNVTVLTRSGSISTTTPLPAAVAVKQVDYSSFESLKSALQGHDVVISTLTPSAIPLQKPIIDASIAVGVRRFVPADYGAICSDPSGEAQKLPCHAAAVEIQNYLRERESKIEHTIFAVGAFLERIFTMPVVVDFAHRAARLYDGGVHAFSASRTSTVAKAVVGAILVPDETRNRVVRVHDTVLTQLKVYDLARKWTAGEEWSETSLSAAEELDRTFQSLQKNFDPALFPPMFLAAFLSGRYGAAYRAEELDNKLLGLELMSDEEVEKFGRELSSGLATGNEAL